MCVCVVVHTLQTDTLSTVYFINTSKDCFNNIVYLTLRLTLYVMFLHHNINGI